MKQEPSRPPKSGQPRRGRPAQPPRRRAVFTIVSANYIGYAATLMQSVATHVPEAERFIILADTRRDFSGIDLAATLLDCSQLGIALLGNMQAWYTVIEFNTAIKPYVFLHLFETMGFDEACYIDPDILLFSGMTEVFNALADHSCVLTPHMMRPLQDGREPSDLTIMKSGIYNLGFLGLRADEDGLALARWWADRCLRHCRVDIAGHLFTDQRWMDLAPAFVRRPYILRHPGYNVAYWNLAHRHVTRTQAGAWQVNGERLVFFHFSGISPNVPGSFSKHQNRFNADNLGEVGELCDLYRRLVLANEWEAFSRLEYGFAALPGGRRLDDHMRHWIARAVEQGEIDAHAPIALGPEYFDQPDQTASALGALLTRYMYQYWLDRPDLRAAFDVATPSGLKGYTAWFLGGDALRQHADPLAVDAARALCQPAAPAAPRPEPEPEPVQARTGPLWPPIAEEVWAARSTEALPGLAQDVVLASSGIAARLPRLAALAWERRADLRQAFDLADPARVREFLAWALTNGVREGALDPAALSPGFVAGFVRLSSLSAHYGDVPITDGMILFRHLPTGRNPLPNWRRFPDERPGRLAHGLWFAFVAPRLFGWPDSLTAPVRAWFHAPSDVVVDGFTLNRACAAIWELRADLVAAFPPAEPGAAWRFVRWLMLNGLRDLGVGLDALDPNLRHFLLGASPRVDGASQLLEIVHSFRTDLQARHDLADPAQRAALVAWAARQLAAETRALPLGAALRPPPAPAADPPPVHHAGLVLTGAWSAPTGRGEDVRGSARALTAAGFTDYVVVDLEAGIALLPDGTELAPGTEILAGTNIVHTNADTAMQDAIRLRRLGVRAERAIGFWAWELEWLPAFWRHAYNFYDEVWAATAFAEAAFRRDAPRPVSLVPMAVSEPELPPGLDRAAARAASGLPAGDTVFLFMFDFRSYAQRKNPHAVLRAFAEAFPLGSETVRLVIKTSGAADRPEEAAALAGLAGDTRIELRDAKLARPALLGLIAAADAFVSLHRSEGFGRGPAEAMLLGTPVILTDYSGSADYATSGCALLVDHTLVPVSPAEYPGVTGQSWAEANVATAATHMRWVHENGEAARALGARGRARIEQLYAPAVVGAAMLRALGLGQGAAKTGRRRRAAGVQNKEA